MLALAIRSETSPLSCETSSEDKLDHAPMNVIARRAFERSDVKAGWTAHGPGRRRHHVFAARTGWSTKRAHDVVPYIRREHHALSHR